LYIVHIVIIYFILRKRCSSR